MFCSELFKFLKLWIVTYVGLCSKTHQRFEFVTCAKNLNLELFRKWCGFLLKMNDSLNFRKEVNSVICSSRRAN